MKRLKNEPSMVSAQVIDRASCLLLLISLPVIGGVAYVTQRVGIRIRNLIRAVSFVPALGIELSPLEDRGVDGSSQTVTIIIPLREYTWRAEG